MNLANDPSLTFKTEDNNEPKIEESKSTPESIWVIRFGLERKGLAQYQSLAAQSSVCALSKSN